MEQIEQALIQEAISVLKKNKRPEILSCPIYGQYDSEERYFLYDDASQRYALKQSVPEKKTIRSVKAFAAFIKEELRRRENETGEMATVSVNLSGGIFIPDDNFGQSVTSFERLNSQQWNLLKRSINKIYDHKEFLLLVQALKPSIGDAFQELFKRFALLRIVGKSEITSNPILTENGQTEGYTCTYKLEDGCDGEETFPKGFSVRVPFAKAGDFLYDIDIDLLFSRDEDNQIQIEVLCPTFENVEEQAIIDESEYIKEQMVGCDNLLVLSDF